MFLVDRLKEDLKTALKSGQEERVGVLRLLLAEANNKQKEKYGGNPQVLSDEDAIAVFQKEAKKRREAIELFHKGNRDDLVRKDEGELRIIEEYLPKQLAPEEIRAVIEKLVAGGLKDFNSLMKEAMKELRGRVDGRTVSDLIKEMLK